MKQNNTTILPNTFFLFSCYFIKKYQWQMIAVILLSCLSGTYGSLSSYLSKILLDTVENSDRSLLASAMLWPAILFILNYEAHNMIWRSLDYIHFRLAPKIKNDIISSVFSSIQHYSFRFFQTNLIGSVASHLDLLPDNVERLFNHSLSYFISITSQIIFSLLLTYWVNPIFCFALFVWLALFICGSILLSRHARNLSTAYAQSRTIVSGKIVDSFQGSLSSKLFYRANFETSYLMKYLEIMKQKFLEKEYFLFIVWSIQSLSMTLLIGFMLYFLVKLRAQDLVSIGDFALILGLVFFITDNIWDLTDHIELINHAIGQINQSLKILIVPVEIKDKPNAHPLKINQGSIEFKKVQFHYKGAEPLFHNKSISIRAGQRVGLVGYSGSGKSTFVNLILRLFEVNSGSILIDEQNIQEVTLASLRQNIAMIPQDPALFHRSLMENIRYARLEASDDEVMEAAKRAHAHEFIQKLPLGYQTIVGGSQHNLSGGQKQRISIARAILKNAPILILDEATSQLDSITEHDIQESLWELMEGKTTLVIAHRLSTLLHMDTILVFNKGKIVENGTHKTLLEQNGLYKSLWDIQVAGFLPDGEVITIGDSE